MCKLEAHKTAADAALAFAEKVIGAARTDQAKARAEDLKREVAAKAAELATQLETAQADTEDQARCSRGRTGSRQGGRSQEG